MPVSLRWNRLVIAAGSEEEFISAVLEYFPQLLQLPYDKVELDITGTPEISEDAFRSIAIRLIGGEAADKKMLIRIPPSVDRYFRHANLYRMVEIDVVRDIPRNGAGNAGKVKAAIEAGKYETRPDTKKKSKSVKPQPEMTESAPTELAPELPSLEPSSRPPRAAQPASATAAAWLLDIETGARHEVKDKLMIGREAPADLVYQVPTISKRHFVIRRGNEGFTIEDLRSTNGTYLNGLPVHEPVPLRDGDEVVVAITLKHPKGARVFQFTTRPA
jgi:hypothetical protein